MLIRGIAIVFLRFAYSRDSGKHKFPANLVDILACDRVGGF